MTDQAPRGFSYARLAISSIGAATAVLIVTTVVIGVFEPGPGIGLTIALAGVVGAIAAMGITATRITNRAFDEQRGRGGPSSGDPEHSGGPERSGDEQTK